MHRDDERMFEDASEALKKLTDQERVHMTAMLLEIKKFKKQLDVWARVLPATKLYTAKIYEGLRDLTYLIRCRRDNL